jgi:Gas vesicle synthesis protein GvpL/GvpF
VIEAPTGTAWYVHGVAEDDPALGRIPGVELICHGTLAAIVREVPLQESGEGRPSGAPQRPRVARAQRRAHEDVLQGTAAATAVVPLWFGTIYRGREHVAEILGERAGELTETIERVRGHVELGVKAWIDLSALERTLAAGDVPAPGGGAGAAYLQQRARAGALARARGALRRARGKRRIGA